jgi:hypothetical protein
MVFQWFSCLFFCEKSEALVTTSSNIKGKDRDMKNEKTPRLSFIQAYRREHRWATPAVAIGAILVAVMPLLIDTSLLGYLGAALLAPTMLYGAFKSYSIFRGTDDEVLRAAGESHLGLLGLMGLGMVLFGAGVGGTSNAIGMSLVVLFTVQSVMKRVSVARRFSTEAV